MAKQITVALGFLEKSVAPLLIMILTILFTLKSDLSAVQEMAKSYEKAQDKLELIANETQIVKTRQTYVIDKLLNVEQAVKITRETQIERTDEIDCINSIRDVLGCSVPASHP